MKIEFYDEGSFARIWLTGPFWQLNKARRIAEAGMAAAPVTSWESKGFTFQITMSGKNSHILRAYKACVREAA